MERSDVARTNRCTVTPGDSSPTLVNRRRGSPLTTRPTTRNDLTSPAAACGASVARPESNRPLLLSHFCGLACRMFRLGRTAGSRFGRKQRDCRICYGFGFEGCRFGVSWCRITNKVLDTHVVFQEPRLTAVFAEASERHIHDLLWDYPLPLRSTRSTKSMKWKVIRVGLGDYGAQ